MGKADLTHLSLGLALCALTAPAWANDPLSAIEWLERRPEQIVTPLSQIPRAIDEPPVADQITTPQVAVTPLGAPERGAAGLLPSTVTGLPRNLWSGSDVGTLSSLLARVRADDHPALLSLLYTLLLAEADAPLGSGSEAFLNARAQKLLELGALDPADALLKRAGPAHPALFDTFFDVNLLASDAVQACAFLRADPALSRDLSRRIFCDARAQDWDTAALTLSTADAIGALSKSDTALLEHFLDPELFEGTAIPRAPAQPTALQFRLYAAIGEALPTAALPRVFAATDLGGDAGWKAQAEAAERLVRVGAISENSLLGIYTSRIPSASGGIWDRIEAVQRLETALGAGDPAAILKQARHAWQLMQAEDLGVPFAALFARDLLRLPTSAQDADLVTRIALLSPAYEQAARRKTSSPLIKAAQAVARGEQPESGTGLQSAIARAFDMDARPPTDLVGLVQDQQLGEAILRAISRAAAGADGDPAALSSALIFFRKSGLEDTARRHALHTLLTKAEGG
ncbi:MAG: hypothetical protein AAF891_08585 [Pseudomonadota bacterium]